MVFGSDNALFGLLMRPTRNSVSRDTGIVVCAPLGLENVFSYRALRTLGLHLADIGFPVLRFDWLGCGDSGELPSTNAGPDLWRDAVRDAIDALVSATGVSEVALVGLRIGATFGLLEATVNPAVSRVVLLKPYATGRAYLSELRAFERVTEHTISSKRPPGPFALPEGAMEAGGFLLTAGEVEALHSIDLEDTRPWPHTPHRSLILSTRSERATSTLSRLLEEEGSQVASHVDPNLSNLWAASTWSFLPSTCKQLVADWLVEDKRRRWRPPRRRIPSSRVAGRLSVARGMVNEQATTIETERDRLFALTSLPARSDRIGDEWVVFLNAGTVRRIGPNRFYTSWARKWAEANLPSLRLDVYGIGDSDGGVERDEALVEDPLILHDPGRLLDVKAALDWLADSYGARRFALIGLCAGGTHAFQTGLSDRRVGAVGLLNPGSLIVDSRVRGLTAWDRAHLGAATQPPASYDQSQDGSSPANGWRSYAPALCESLARMQASHTRAAVIFAAEDEGIHWLRRILGPDFRTQLESFGIKVEIIDGPDHTFRPLWSHGLVYDFLERFLISTGFLDVA